MANLSAHDIAKLHANVVVADSHAEQYIIFTINDQEYGVSIMAVREIRGWTQESKLPGMPSYIRGVINLRGVVIPIIDLRSRFSGAATETTKTHVVIVMQAGEHLKGVLVDAISDILPIPDDQIRPAPELESNSLEAHYVSGLYTPEGRIIALLAAEDICATTLPALGHHGVDDLALSAGQPLAVGKPH